MTNNQFENRDISHFHLNGRSGPLTLSRACQKSLLIRRDVTLLSQGRRANQAALRPDG